MDETMLFLHFVGLMLGAAGGFASAVIMRRALALPAEEAKVLRGVGPILAKVSLLGLVLLWATGLVMVWSKWGGFSGLPQLFWVKAIFIASLTVITILINMTYGEIRKGNPAVAARLPKLGPLAGISALLAVLFAVLTFQ